MLLDHARALLDREQASAADRLLQSALEQVSGAPPEQRLRFEELACQAAFKLGDHARALSHAGQAAALAQQLGDRERSALAQLAMSNLHERLGAYREALSYHQSWARLRGELAEEAARARLARAAEPHKHEQARLQMELALRDVTLAETHLRLAEQTREIEALTRCDPLTGILTRRAFSERLADDFERARRYSWQLAVARIDIDGLRAINDAFGTSAGDEVVRRVADLLASKLRNVDVPGRWGGDEFAVLLPETGPEGARLVCEKLRAAVEGWHWELVAPGLRVTVSGGIACGTELSNWELLLAAADAQLFQARQQGRNRICGPG